MSRPKKWKHEWSFFIGANGRRCYNILCRRCQLECKQSFRNQRFETKLAPMVVVIDEFADLADQLESKKDKEAFFTPVKRIAQIGRKRGIHLVLCTQRPAATLVPSNIKSQLNGRLALRVNDANSSRMILEESGAQYLQKHGDMIYKNGSETERAQGYYISIEELDAIVDGIINGDGK